MNTIIRKFIKKMAYLGIFDNLSDDKYLKLLFYAHLNSKLDLNTPKTFNEKLQWMKLNDRKEIYTNLVDKYEVKKYISKTIGEEYVIPTLGVWKKFEDIDFDILPNQFVLKCTHDSGGLVICKDKTQFNKEDARHKINASLKRNYFNSCREWPYKNVKPQIIAEPFIGVDNRTPDDFKFFTFNGCVDCVMVCKDRDKGYPWFYFYNKDWKRLKYQWPELEKEDEIEKPIDYEKMIKLAEILANDFKQIRVDFYNVNGRIYFGELTFFNQSGFDTDISYETDLYWGDKLAVPF